MLAGPDARYDCTTDDSLAAHAVRRGVSAGEAFIDLSLETDGAAAVNFPFLNQSLDAVEEMLGNKTVVMGLADAGAHVGQIMDASQPTFFLTYWVREQGLCTIEEGVRRLTSDTAELFGVKDRGVLRPGAFADVNVIDLDGLRLAHARVRARLPRRRRPLRPALRRLRHDDRERRGVHARRRAHRRPRRTHGALDRLTFVSQRLAPR